MLKWNVLDLEKRCGKSMFETIYEPIKVFINRPMLHNTILQIPCIQWR